MPQSNQPSKAKLFLTQFLLPQTNDLIVYLLVSLFVLLLASNKTLLVILSGDTPVINVSVTGVFGQRVDYLNHLLQEPVLGRVVLFLFWLAIGSIVYMLVWLFQNIAVEVYDDIHHIQLKDRQTEDGGWWGTTLAHTIFIGSGAILFMFFLVIVADLLLPAWSQLFQIGLQNITQVAGIMKLLIAILGMMLTIHIFVLFWRLFFRLRDYIYHSF